MELLSTKKDLKVLSKAIDDIAGPGHKPTAPHPIPNKVEPITRDELIFFVV